MSLSTVGSYRLKFKAVFMTVSARDGCRLTTNTIVPSKCSFSNWARSETSYSDKNSLSKEMVFSAAGSDFDIRAGFIALRKNVSFSLLRQNPIILVSSLLSSTIKASIGLNYPLSPFARMWARYLESLASRLRASLGLRPKWRMTDSRKSSRRESAWLISLRGSTSLRLI